MPRLILFLIYFFTVTPTFIGTLWVLEKLHLPGRRAFEFRSALIGAVTHTETIREVMLQPVSIGYTRIQDIPMGRQHRGLVAWYGDIDFTPHFKRFLSRCAVDVVVTFGQAVPFDNGLDRKTMVRTAENTVRRLTAATLRERTIETVT